MTRLQKEMFFNGRPRSRLVNTTWKEISGVDHPANETEGWLVMKAKQLGGNDGDDEWAEELAEELYETDFSECGPEVEDAAHTLITWLAQVGYDGQSEQNSEEPGEFLKTAVGMTDFSSAPPNVKQAAAGLAAYLAAEHNDDNDDDDDDDNLYKSSRQPPIGIQLYGGTNRKESNGLYGLRSGRGSQSFVGALSNGITRRARGMDLTKSYGAMLAGKKGKKAGKMPTTFKQLAKAIQKAAGSRFYGNDFGDQPFITGGNNSYTAPQSTSQFRGSDTGGGQGGSFFNNWTNPAPYIATGNNGVSDGELANGLENVARLSRQAGKDAADAAFDQFLSAGWPSFSKKAADIIANYSSRVTSPTWTGGGGDVSPPAEMVKAKEEITKAVEELKDFVLSGMEAVAKRDFSSGERRRLARQGKALPGGSYPIPNRASLMDARHAIGRAKNKPKARALIRRRARELGVKLPSTFSK